MPEQLQRILNRIAEWWKGFTNQQRAIIISVAAVVIVAFGILGYVVTRPTTVTLVTATDATESSEIQSLLDGEGIEYTLSSDGLTFTINEEDQSTANILLGSNDIPSSGYSIEDALDGSFTSTESDKQKRYQLYLESKFANDLETLSNVSDAVVTLSIPVDDGTLISQDEDSYASVILTLSGEMDETQAAGLATYIATELGNDDTANILILDSDSNILFSGGDDTSTYGTASSNLTAREKAESYVASTVKSVVLGTDVYDNVEVGINLSMNFDQTTIADYDYSVDDDRTEGYLDSETYSTSESTSGSGGVPGTDTNDDDTTYVLEDYSESTSTTEEYSRDYLPDETITETIEEVGSISREDSTITVVATNYVIYNEEELEASGALDDMTFDEFVSANSERVKTEVDEDFYSMVSNATGIPTDNITIVAYDIPMFQYAETSSRTFTDYLQIILAVLILLMLGFVVFRTLRSDQEEELAEEVTVESLLESQEELEDIGFSEKSDERILIEKFVDENPEAVATLLRNWLNEDWG